MKRRKLAVRRSKVARKTRKNPSEYGIAPVIIAGLIGLASTLGGGLLSGRRAKKNARRKRNSRRRRRSRKPKKPQSNVRCGISSAAWAPAPY